MKKQILKKWLAAALLVLVTVSSIPSPVQAAAKKTGIPQKSEMKKQGFVYIKGGTYKMVQMII